MANPQLENGYIRIANEIYKEIYKIDLSASELRILLFVIFQTYGFNKKIKKMSANYISQGTEIPVKTVRRALNGLINKNILFSKNHGQNNSKSYGIVKDYDKWLLKNEYPSTQKRVSPQTSTPLLTNGLPKNEPKGTQNCAFDYSKMSTNTRQYNTRQYKQDSSSSTTTTDSTLKPTLENIKSYVKEKGYKFNPEKFYQHYEILGWEYKGTPIKNWKLLADRWNNAERNTGVQKLASYDIDELEKIK